MITIIVRESASSHKFGVVNRDYDQVWRDDAGNVTAVKKSRPSRNGVGIGIRSLPATARFIPSGKKDTVSLHKSLQLWMHKNSHVRIPSTPEAEAKAAWSSLMDGGEAARFMTDFAGSKTHADYVNGRNLDKEPMKAKPLATGGTIVSILGEQNVGGNACYVIEAVDPLGDFEAINLQEKWWLFFYPASSCREVMRDAKRNVIGILEYISEPFPQYKDNTIMPILGMEGNNYAFVQKDRVTELKLGAYASSPFVRSTVSGYVTPYYKNPYEGKIT